MFSDESGLLYPGKRQTPYFGLGGLAIPDSEIKDVRSSIRDLRECHHFFVNFEYKYNLRYKVPFCKDLLDWYFENDKIGFFILVLRTADLDWTYWHRGGQEPHNACYSYMYRLMLSSFVKDYAPEGSSNVTVIIDTQSLGQKELRNRFNYFMAYPSIKACEERNSYEDDLLQLVDLLTSCTINRFTLFEYPEFTKCPVKNGISQYLSSKLGLKHFWNWRRVGENWGPEGVRWVGDPKNPDWERPATLGTKKLGKKFDLYSWHGK